MGSGIVVLFGLKVSYFFIILCYTNLNIFQSGINQENRLNTVSNNVINCLIIVNLSK